jgi:hypothetical protein
MPYRLCRLSGQKGVRSTLQPHIELVRAEAKLVAASIAYEMDPFVFTNAAWPRDGAPGTGRVTHAESSLLPEGSYVPLR